MKPYVESIQQPVKFAEKSWGSYRVIDIDDEKASEDIVDIDYIAKKLRDMNLD